jgi:hypothetical protein
MPYAVCTSCPFLRAYRRDADVARIPDTCPQCGSTLNVRGTDERFPSAYVSKVSLKLLATPELRADAPK